MLIRHPNLLPVLLILLTAASVVEGQPARDLPTTSPTSSPTSSPTTSPTSSPTSSPSESPSGSPSSIPSASPSSNPSAMPSGSPSSQPSAMPSGSPSSQPSGSPSSQPSAMPSGIPSSQPSGGGPSSSPSLQPSGIPSSQPSGGGPSSSPSLQPSGSPSSQPSGSPSSSPSSQPSMSPSSSPSQSPSSNPSAQPSQSPSSSPSDYPSRFPSPSPSMSPSVSSAPSAVPSCSPPPAIGCGFGVWNVASCSCLCVEAYCPDLIGACYRSWSCPVGPTGSSNDFLGCTTNMWRTGAGDMVNDCPWYNDPHTDSCTSAEFNNEEVPAGIKNVYITPDECCLEEYPMSVAACLAINSTDAPNRWYPDYDTENCKNDDMQPADFNILPSRLLPTAEECCEDYFGWKDDDCIKEAAILANVTLPPTENEIFIEANPWYPDWGRSELCLNDGDFPEYVRRNPQQTLLPTIEDCCMTHYGWETEGCIVKTAAAAGIVLPSASPTKSPTVTPTPQPTGSPTFPPVQLVQPSGTPGQAVGRPGRWFVDWALVRCVDVCQAQESDPTTVAPYCAGRLNESWEITYPTDTVCCDDILWWQPECVKETP